jgi:hypothetical protein
LAREKRFLFSLICATLRFRLFDLSRFFLVPALLFYVNENSDPFYSCVNPPARELAEENAKVHPVDASKRSICFFCGESYIVGSVRAAARSLWRRSFTFLLATCLFGI